MNGILKRHSNLFSAVFRVIDPVFVLVCSYFFYWSGWFAPEALAKVLSVYCGSFAVIVFHFIGIYRSWRVETLSKEIKILSGAWLLVLLMFNFMILLIANEDQRAVLGPYGAFKIKMFWIWGISVLSGMICIRLVIRTLLRALRKKGWNQRHVLIAGSGEVGIKLAHYINQTDILGIKIKGFFDDRTDMNSNINIGNGINVPVLGKIRDTIEYAVMNKVDMVFITLPMRADKKINELVWGLGLQGINVMMVPDLFAFGLQKAKVIHIGQTPVMLFNLFPAWKRFFDLLFSVLALIFFSPLMVMIMAMIKKEDKGDIFYGHERVREQGRIFKCLKFRTMYMDADKKLEKLLDENPGLASEWERTYKLKNDPRITRIGRFLRKTSLDELPQFINVLRGEMSIVGARPVVKDELDKYYTSSALTYCSMKPGLTGPWQVGKRNDVQNYEERVELDRLYVLNSNIWIDLRIIFKTIWKMISGRGAY